MVSSLGHRHHDVALATLAARPVLPTTVLVDA
ncbi:hypothetical protein FBZ87_106171 [Nitrospirillum amazonense]|uniref:Uncharacterized protein n=1 Tax=Nitrospirillum amazonense TaxID=28077 RepID=A0A560JLU4_9PROT|nr:hypothetical protein FBZ87_106171 [Nitrospirillum amazonense]